MHHRPVKSLVLVLCLVLAGLGPARGELFPVGEEIPLLDGPGCTEDGLDVAPLPGGGFVAVWSRYPDPSRPGAGVGAVFARLYDVAGQGLGPAHRIASSVVKARPAVAINDGWVLVAWQDREANGAVAQIFGIDGGVLSETPARTVIPLSSLSSDLDAAPLENGFAVLVTEGNSASLTRLGPTAKPLGTEVIRPPDTFLPIWSLGDPRLVAHGSSGLVAAWTGTWNEQRRIEAKVLGVVPSPVFVVRSSQEPGAGMPGSPALASAADGGVLVTWREEKTGDDPLYSRLFDGTGAPLGLPRLVSGESSLSDPALATDGAGGFFLAWVRRSSLPDAVEETMIRSLSPAGEPLAILSRAARTDLGGRARLQLVRNGQHLVLAWDYTVDITIDPCGTVGLWARRFQITSDLLPLQAGRFRLSVRWTDHQGQSGEGWAVPLTEDSGYFWFFGPDNVELMVKVLDGRAINGRFWVFYASLSDVAYTLTVTDTFTGLTQEYENPAGQLASRADTATFAAGPAEDAEDAAAVQAGRPVTVPAAVTMEKAGPCTDPSLPVSIRPGLCLGRFEVEVTWRNPNDGTTGAGQGVRLTADSGYLWFFGANNIELVVKVLDGRAVNGHFWVFYGAMSNVEYTVLVRDTQTGTERTYRNPAGQLASRADTEAF